MNRILENIIYTALVFSIIVLSVAIFIYAIKTSNVEKIINNVMTENGPSSHRKVSRIYLCFKRFFDILFSINALLVCSPIMLWLYIILKCYKVSSGIKAYKIVGSRGKSVKFYQFNMFEKSADGSTDARVLSKMIYEMRLYKIPMYFSVLKGDMSIVGLERILYRDGIDKNLLKEYQYLKPGMISLSDVYRRQIPKSEFNKRYAENIGLKVDMSILLYVAKSDIKRIE